MDNLKHQTHTVLSKILQQISKQKQEDEKNQFTNPQNEVVPITCKELVDLYSHNLEAKQKILLQITLANDLRQQMNTIQFRQKINKTLEEMNMDNNQFNIPEAQLPKNLANKNSINKGKKMVQAKKYQPSVQSHPEYFRVDHQVCRKLFQHYKALPLGIPKHGGFNFQQKQHHKNSMNYHKILQILKNAKITVDINQKLLILRSIKKFCFNQSFINNQQFIKVFKVVIHGLGFKQQIFQQLIKKYANQKDMLKNAKNQIQKPRRNYRFKTDGSAIDRTVLQYSKNDIDTTTKQILKPLITQKKGYEKVQSGKKLGNIQGLNMNNNVSYLAKAMEGQKISKITWQSLFNMKQTTMHSFITVPSFVRNVNLEQF